MRFLQAMFHRECGIAHVSQTLRAAEEWQAAYVLGAGGIVSHGERLAAASGRVLGGADGERTGRLGAVLFAAQRRSSGSAAGADAVRSAPPRRTAQRRAAAGEARQHSAGADARFRRRVAGLGLVADAGTRRAAGASDRAGAGRRVVGHGRGDSRDRAVLRTVERTAHRRHLVSADGAGRVAGRVAGAGSHGPLVQGLGSTAAAQRGPGETPAAAAGGVVRVEMRPAAVRRDEHVLRGGHGRLSAGPARLLARFAGGIGRRSASGWS